MLGIFGVGKTSLVRRFVYNKFEEKYLSTIGVSISQKQLDLMSNASFETAVQMNLTIWDIAQIEKFNGVVKNYYRGAHGAIVVFDVIRTEAFDTCSCYLESYLEINPNSKLIFVANKVDLITKEKFDTHKLSQTANQYKSPYLLTSAKTGGNVNQLFMKLGNLLLEKNEL